MDFLAVAAAAGAGYVAKYLHKATKENDGESNSDSMNVVQGRLETKCDGSYTDSRCLGGNVVGKMNLGAESTSGEGLGDLGRYQDFNLLSLASFPLGLSDKEIFRLGKGIGNVVREEIGECSRSSLPDSVGREVGFCHSVPVPRGGRFIRSRRSYKNFSKPLNSLESCPTAPLYTQHSEMENYLHTLFPSSSLRARPLLVTDGKQVISRASSTLQADTRLLANRIEDKLHLGAPRLPKKLTEIKRRLKQTSGQHLPRKFKSPSCTAAVGLLDPQGSRNVMRLFLMGVTVGILSTAVANKREMDKTHELLKQTENLVQDLQEEIEMKHSMTVKELVSERVGIQESDTGIFALEDPTTSMEKLVNGEKDCSKEDNQTAKHSEIMSQIEEELEAELERLELNMKGSTLERIADLVELDPDYEADVAKGEFRLDTMTKRWNEDSMSDADNQGSTSSGHTYHANRPVSPRQLSLRLHEVIEERLEARIMELETALENSQKKLRSLELSSMKAKECCEKGSSFPDEQNNFDQPLVINLAGDALDAYNEAYEEIFRMVKTEDETPPDTIFKNNKAQSETIQSQNQSLSDLPTSQSIKFGERTHISSIEKINWEEQLSDNIDSGDESEGDDILGKLLIQQIVEKSRQGSSLVLNAQRMLYNMEE